MRGLCDELRMWLCESLLWWIFSFAPPRGDGIFIRQYIAAYWEKALRNSSAKDSLQ